MQELSTVTSERIVEAMRSHNLAFAMTPKGDFFIPYAAHTVFISNIGSATMPTWICEAQWSRRVDIAYMAKVKNYIQQQSATAVAPKMTFRVNDDGRIAFRASWVFNWRDKATDEQIKGELAVLLIGTERVFSELAQEFPDPWAAAPKEADQ